MIDGKRIVGYTPFGRMQTFSMLVPYLLRAYADGQLDHFMLCLNFQRDVATQLFDGHQAEDEAYAQRLVDWYPELFSVYKCPGLDTPDLADDLPPEWMRGYRQPKQLNTMRFFWYMQDPDAIYVRLDDDIVWLHSQFFPELVGAKIARPDLLAVFPLIWNNAICSHVLQRNGHLDGRWGTAHPHATDPVGWMFPAFAQYVHETLLHHLDHDHEDACRTVNLDGPLANDPVGDWYELGWRQQFSVSSFAISGREYAELGGVLNWDEEEHWLTMHQPSIVKRGNAVYTGAQCAHLTFYTQRDFIWATDIPNRYWRHSEELYKSLPGKLQRGR